MCVTASVLDRRVVYTPCTDCLQRPLRAEGKGKRGEVAQKLQFARAGRGGGGIGGGVVRTEI